MKSRRIQSTVRRSHFRVPRVDGLEDRCLLAVVFNQVGDVLTITGDGGINNVSVLDNGTNVFNNVSATGDGSNFLSNSTVREIRIRTFGGNDQIRYTVGNLIPSSPRKIMIDASLGDDRVTVTAGNLASGFQLSADLGAGNDRFLGTVNGANAAAVTANINGGLGNDNIQFTNNGAVNSSAASQASLGVRADGGSENDVINVTNNGVANGGPVSLSGFGGTGDDRITLANRADVSSGVVGGVSRLATVNLRADGGAGNDILNLNQTGRLTGASLFASATGNTGRDQINIERTGDVNVLAGFVNPSVVLTADGGADVDTISVRSQGALNSANLTSRILGGLSRDRLSYLQTGNIGSLSTSTVTMDGGASEDTMTYGYSGGLLAATSSLLFRAEGGTDDDFISAVANLSAGSSGRVGAPGSAATVSGGTGGDRLSLQVRPGLGSTTTVTAVVDGGLGIDSCQRTVNVTSISCASDTVIL